MQLRPAARAVARFATLAAATGLVHASQPQIFFARLPGGFIAAALYLDVSSLYQQPFSSVSTP